MDKIFGCFARLQTTTSLQYFYTKNLSQILDLAAAEETSYLVNLFDRVLLIHAEGFDGEDHFRIPWIGESPNISESPGCERSLARLAERVRNRVRRREDPI